MKHASMYKRVLSVMLVLAMLFTTVIPTVSAEQTKAASNLEELTLTPIDASTLESRKLNSNPDDSIEAEAHKLTDLVRVSIQLEKASTVEAGFALEGIADNAAAKDYRSGLRADQAAMTAKIEKAIGGKLDVKWNLTLAANIISANVLYGQIDTIKGIDGVKDVFLENRYEPQEDLKDLSQTPIREPAAAPIADEPENGSASHMIGSNLAWAAGYTGAGSKVAIIDTGVDYTHQSFNSDAFNHAVEQVRAAGKTMTLMTQSDWSGLKLNGSGRYVSAKFPFGYNYVDQTNATASLGHTNDTQGEHGSHVSGIATANRYIKSGTTYKDAATTVHAVGMAPDAQLLVMKVFGETEKKIIGSRHGEKLYETLVTREEMLRSVDMGHYYRIAPDARGLNYDKFYVQGTVHTEGDEAYTSHNTNRLDVDGVVKKIMGTDYVKEELEGRPHAVEA